jgi:hypothetical protein
VQQVALFARRFGKSPDALGPDIRVYQVYLTNERKLAPSSILIATAALRFLYKVTLQRDWKLDEIIPAPKKRQTLPVVLSPEEVVQFLDGVASRKHRTILTTCYAAGLRISEAVRLTLPAIDSTRMVVRVEQGKGQKDRCVARDPLRHWLFSGDRPGRPVTRATVERACPTGRRLCRIPKPITPHSLRHSEPVCRGCQPGNIAPQTSPKRLAPGRHEASRPGLRRPLAGVRHRHPAHPTAPRSSQSGDHRPLPADRHQSRVRDLKRARPAPAAPRHFVRGLRRSHSFIHWRQNLRGPRRHMRHRVTRRLAPGVQERQRTHLQ